MKKVLPRFSEKIIKPENIISIKISDTKCYIQLRNVTCISRLSLKFLSELLKSKMFCRLKDDTIVNLIYAKEILFSNKPEIYKISMDNGMSYDISKNNFQSIIDIYSCHRNLNKKFSVPDDLKSVKFLSAIAPQYTN
ncbi:MAG: LytTR family DNA-binding domain-containing protein [Bacteroidota bacterium]